MTMTAKQIRVFDLLTLYSDFIVKVNINTLKTGSAFVIQHSTPIPTTPGWASTPQGIRFYTMLSYSDIFDYILVKIPSLPVVTPSLTPSSSRTLTPTPTPVPTSTLALTLTPTKTPTPTPTSTLTPMGMPAGTRIASDSTGNKLVVCRPGDQIYTSTDAGINWTARDVVRNWSGVASDSTGTNLVAIVSNGQIHTSVDSGVNWTARSIVRDWSGVVSSRDGTKLYAMCKMDNAYKHPLNSFYFLILYVSYDLGITWTHTLTLPTVNWYAPNWWAGQYKNWQSVATNGTGSQLVFGEHNGQVWFSRPWPDSATWFNWWNGKIPGGWARGYKDWSGVALNRHGDKVVVCEFGGQIYTGTLKDKNSPSDLTARDSNRNWTCVASDTTGKKLVATVSGGQIYTSNNSGVIWTARDSNRDWTWVASSDDGNKLAACVSSGQIYTSTDSGSTWIART